MIYKLIIKLEKMQPTKIDLKVINIIPKNLFYSIAFYVVNLIFTEVRDDIKLY